MKIWILAIIAALAMTLGSAPMVLAQAPTPTPEPTATSTPVPTATLTATPAATPTTAIVRIEGTITAIDPVGKTVTITSDSGVVITLKITDSTEMEVPGKEPASLADLKVGQPVKARYGTSLMTILEIEVREVKPGKIQGVITALDPTAQKVTVAPKQGETVVLTITDKTKIEVWGKEPAVFSDLKVGDTVKAEYVPATKEALEVEAKTKEEPAPGARQGFFGTVKAKTNTSLTLTTKQGDVTFTLDANTQFWNPPQKDATLADVKVGDRIAVLAVRQDSTLLARRVLMIPSKPVRTQVSGTVTKVEGNTITVADKDGNTFTAELPKGLAAKVQVGDILTLTLLRTPGVEKHQAQGLMRGEELRERLNGSLEKTKGKKADTEGEKGKQAKALEKLESLVQRNMERQQEILQKVLDKAPPQVREALEKAKEKSRQGWEQAKEALKTEKEKRRATATPTPRGR